MRFETKQRDGTAIVGLDGELDMTATFALEGELDRLLEREPVQRLVLDLREVAFIDSTGLRLILETDARARDRGIELVVVRGAQDVQRVFVLAGVEELLPFADAPPAVGLPRA
jgi:anti-anti-sigma factor